jgi:hypothetical protein
MCSIHNSGCAAVQQHVPAEHRLTGVYVARVPTDQTQSTSPSRSMYGRAAGTGRGSPHPQQQPVQGNNGRLQRPRQRHTAHAAGSSTYQFSTALDCLPAVRCKNAVKLIFLWFAWCHGNVPDVPALIVDAWSASHKIAVLLHREIL